MNKTATATAEPASGIVETLREAVPETIARSAAQAESLTRLGIERARAAASEMRHQVQQAGDQTVGYIRHEPVKSVLIAAAAGAALAAVLGWALRSR